MDLRRLRIGEWVFGVSGVVLIVSLFLPWWGLEGRWIDLGPGGPIEGPLGEAPTAVTTTWSAWQVFSIADVFLFLLGVLALVVFAIVARAPAPGPGITGEALLTPLAIVMLVVVLVQVLGTPNALEVAPPIADPTLQVGAWLGLASSFAIFLGLLVAMRDERLSQPGEQTDQAGAPVTRPLAVETLPAPPGA